MRFILISDGFALLSVLLLLILQVPEPGHPEHPPPHEQLKFLFLMTFISARMIIAKTTIPTIIEPMFSKMKLSKILTYLVFNVEYGFFLTTRYTSANSKTRATAVSIPKPSPEKRSPSW